LEVLIERKPKVIQILPSEPYTTRLKCKPCHKFYEDDGTVSKCEVCGKDLKQIKVHNLKVSNITVIPGGMEVDL